MKKALLIIGLMFSTLTYGQVDFPESSEGVFNKNKEVRLGVARLLLGNSLDVGFEKIIDRNQSFGANMLIGFNDRDFDTSQVFSLSPYYRFYFNRSQEYGAKGMFVEGFLDFYSGKTEVYNYVPFSENYEDYYKEKSFFDIAGGFALGWKWVNTAGFVFETKIGYGRNILDENPNAEGIFRGDFSVGYRF